jgi:hypothetical protein
VVFLAHFLFLVNKLLKVVGKLATCFQQLGKAEISRRQRFTVRRTLECKHKFSPVVNWPPADAGGSDKIGGRFWYRAKLFGTSDRR